MSMVYTALKASTATDGTYSAKIAQVCGIGTYP